jgi:hypothetical protein
MEAKPIHKEGYQKGNCVNQINIQNFKIHLPIHTTQFSNL